MTTPLTTAQLKAANFIIVRLNSVGTGAHVNTALWPNATVSVMGYVWDGAYTNAALLDVTWSKTNGTITISKIWSERGYDTWQLADAVLFTDY